MEQKQEKRKGFGLFETVENLIKGIIILLMSYLFTSWKLIVKPSHFSNVILTDSDTRSDFILKPFTYITLTLFLLIFSFEYLAYDGLSEFFFDPENLILSKEINELSIFKLLYLTLPFVIFVAAWGILILGTTALRKKDKLFSAKVIVYAVSFHLLILELLLIIYTSLDDLSEILFGDFSAVYIIAFLIVFVYSFIGSANVLFQIIRKFNFHKFCQRKIFSLPVFTCYVFMVVVSSALFCGYSYTWLREKKDESELSINKRYPILLNSEVFLENNDSLCIEFLFQNPTNITQIFKKQVAAIHFDSIKTNNDSVHSVNRIVREDSVDLHNIVNYGHLKDDIIFLKPDEIKVFKFYLQINHDLYGYLLRDDVDGISGSTTIKYINNFDYNMSVWDQGRTTDVYFRWRSQLFMR